MSTNPFVSVIIPAYNAEKTIEACLDSIMNQTYRNYEVIVVDDSSVDNTSTIIKKYPVKLIRAPKNLMAGGARNLGLKYAQGEIIAFTDADGITDKNWLNNI